MIQSIHSRAPTRIDLAGGTVDLWPLYLFLKDPVTLNLGIDLYAEANLELATPSIRGKSQIILRSEDQKTELVLPWEALTLPPENLPPGLMLHYKLVKYFAERGPKKLSSKDLVLRTLARSPAGAGLGGSSTLSIAIIGALAAWANPDQDLSEIQNEKFIDIVRDVETTVIQVPAGLQDYYGAMYGGLQCLRWGAGSHDRKRLSKKLIPELEKRILLFYSGHSRNSGINNWVLFKKFIDRDGDIRSKFQKISDATHQLEHALKSENWEAAGQAIANEWSTRKTLATGITTPEIDQAFAQASQLTPLSGKVCGAGGGGCFFVFLASGNPTLKTQIQEIFLSHGMQSLPFRGVAHGLEVLVT